MLANYVAVGKNVNDANGIIVCYTPNEEFAIRIAEVLNQVEPPSRLTERVAKLEVEFRNNQQDDMLTSLAHKIEAVDQLTARVSALEKNQERIKNYIQGLVKWVES